MGTDIALDLAGLRRTATRASQLAEDFAGAEGVADDIGALTGYARLADKLGEFGDKWDVAREDLRDNLRSLADFMQAIVDTFEDLDEQMAEGTP